MDLIKCWTKEPVRIFCSPNVLKLKSQLRQCASLRFTLERCIQRCSKMKIEWGVPRVSAAESMLIRLDRENKTEQGGQLSDHHAGIREGRTAIRILASLQPISVLEKRHFYFIATTKKPLLKRHSHNPNVIYKLPCAPWSALMPFCLTVLNMLSVFE